jgi:hypothetical protein
MLRESESRMKPRSCLRGGFIRSLNHIWDRGIILLSVPNYYTKQKEKLVTQDSHRLVGWLPSVGQTTLNQAMKVMTSRRSDATPT